MATLIDQIREELVAADVARIPGEAGAGGRPWLPPVFRAPPDGTPAPGSKTGHNQDDDGLVLAIFFTGEIPPTAGGGYSNRFTYAIDFRSKAHEAIELAAEQIRDIFAPAAGGLEGAGIPGIRIDWTLRSTPPRHVIESRLWTGLQDLGMSRAEGYHQRLQILLETYR